MSNLSNSKLLQQLENYKNNYYSENSKNIFLKNKQKIECAEVVSSQCNIEELISKTVYLIKDTNKVYIDYPIFKMYAHPSIYQRIIEHTQNILDECIHKYDCFEVHVNLKSFTISAAERYRQIIQDFYEAALSKNTVYYVKMNKIYVYYTPSAIGDIAKLLLQPEILPKVHTYSKDVSDSKIRDLFYTPEEKVSV